MSEKIAKKSKKSPLSIVRGCFMKTFLKRLLDVERMCYRKDDNMETGGALACLILFVIALVVIAIIFRR